MHYKKAIVNGMPTLLVCFIILNLIILIIYLFAFFSGETVTLLTFLIITSNIGYGLIMRRIFELIQNKKRIRPYEYAIGLCYHSACMFLWFPFYLAIIFTGLAIVGTIVSYNKQG
jgi:hypothetical protein